MSSPQPDLNGDVVDRLDYRKGFSGCRRKLCSQGVVIICEVSTGKCVISALHYIKAH